MALRELLVFVVAGLTLGALYGLTATGLTLTYKTSGILNFAHGAVAIVAVDAYIYLAVNRGMPWQPAAFVSVFVVGPAVGVAMERLGRTVVGAPPALRVAATVGVSVAVTGAAALIGRRLIGSRPRFTPPPLPGTTVELAGVNVGKDQLILMGVSLVAVAGLSLFLRFARIGVALRAVVDDPDLVDCSGRDPRALRRASWAIGTTFASLSGVLLALAPTFGGGGGALGRLVVPAFGAAAIGRFASLPGTYAGGLAIGVAASLLTRYVTADWLLALPTSLPVIVLFGVLLATPRRLLTERWRVDRRFLATPRTLPPVLAGVGGSVLLVVLLLVPAWSGFRVNLYTTWLVYALVFVSLGLLVRTSGQVSLCHLGLAAVGAATFARVAAAAPWPIAVIVAGLVTAAVGAVVAVSAIRLAGVFLALATLAFGTILQQFFYTSNLMFGRGVALAAPRPSFARTDAHYYYLVLAILAAATCLVVAITRTRLGRLLRALGDAPLALESQGASTNVTKLVVFALSASMAGIGGALLVSLNNVASVTPFSPEGSLSMVAILFVLPFGEPLAGLAAAAAYYLLPLQLEVVNPGAWTGLVFGIVAVLVVATTPGRARRRGRREPSSMPPLIVSAGPSLPGSARRAAPSARPEGAGLVLDRLSVRFGGVVALDAVSLSAPIGRVTGLIGPNGAGKTTLFNVSTGLVRPASGSVRFGGAELPAGLGPAARARLGIGRTFQQPQLFDSMTVADVVALGREAGLAGASPRGQAVPRRHDAAAVARDVAEAVELTGIGALLGTRAGDLSAGERRLVELARCLAAPFDLLLLDEPSAGLDRVETELLVAVVREVVAHRGTGVLLVEHDMSVVTGLCDQVFVLDFGLVIFEGTPDELLASSAVRAAYLGAVPVS